MDLKDIKDLSDNLDQKQSNAILGLIDQKINSDMEKVLEKMDSIKVEMVSMDKRLENKINTFGHRLSTLQVLLWSVIGALVGLVITLIFKH